ncbi:MAG: cbb3-type cytochrome oxidase assembly protein CcoS [Planctomycetota bacterium]
MMTIWIVLPIALILASIGVWAFLWSVRSGQLDDLDTPALRMLLDEDPMPAAPKAQRERSRAVQAREAGDAASTAVNA